MLVRHSASGPVIGLERLIGPVGVGDERRSWLLSGAATTESPMVRIICSTLAVLLCASAALGQEAPTAESQTMAEPNPSAEASNAFTLNTPIQALAADQGARAVLDRELPGLTTHESYDQFKGMSLKTLMPLSGGLITDERLDAVEAGLRTLGTPET